MSSIYQDVIDIQMMIDDSFDKDTGEINEADVQAGEELKAEIISVGLEKLCKVRANIMATAEGLKAEKKRIDDALKRENSKLERLEDYILTIHKLSGEKKSIAGTFTVSMRKSESVELAENFEHADFGRYEFKPDKTAIKKAIKDGVEIEGATLIEKENLQVK